MAQRMDRTGESRMMEDDDHGLRGRAPMSPDQSVVTLSPIIDSVDGMNFKYGAMDGRVPSGLDQFIPGEESKSRRGRKE